MSIFPDATSILEYEDVILDDNEALMLQHIGQKDPTHAIAGRMLRNALFSEDLQANVVSEALKSSPIKNLEQYFIQFYNESLGHLVQADAIALGYTVWTYSDTLDERFGEERVITPVHVDRQRYGVIARTHKDERVEFIPFRRGNLKPSTSNYHIFIWPGMKPNAVTGKHNSVISSLVVDHWKMQRLKEMEEKANIQRSNPSYVMEPAISGGSGSATDMAIHTTSTPFGVVNSAKNQEQRLIDAMNERMLAEALRPALGIHTGPDGRKSAIKKESTFETNSHYIPHGYKGASSQPPLPEIPANVLEQDLAYNKLVFASYGIPFSLALGDGKTASSGGSKQTANLGGERDMEMFQKSLLQAIKSIEAFYTEVWFHSFPGSTRREDVKFNLRIVPFTSSGALHGLYNQGIIHEKSLKRRLAQVHGLSEDDIATEKNIITRPPMHGTENHTTAIMDAREEAILAEAAERRAKAAALKKDSTQGEDQKELIKLQIELEREKGRIQIEILEAKLKYEKEKPAPAPPQKKAKTRST
jgi:hypothetical protein